LKKEEKKAKAITSIASGMLIFHDSVHRKKRLDSFVSGDLRLLIIYGIEGRRTYRFVNKDACWKEVTPLRGKKIEDAVTAFLQQSLSIEIVVEAPQEIFAQLRGDGPYSVR